MEIDNTDISVENVGSYVSNKTDCTPGPWDQYGDDLHRRYCTQCNYWYEDAYCYDNDANGICDVCGRTGMHTHNYTEKTYEQIENDSENHKVFLTCSCGTKQDEEGTIELHNFPETPTPNEDGTTHSQTCQDCGYVKTEEHNYENGICTECGEEQDNNIEIETEKYELDDKYISKIQPETTMQEFKENIQTDATEIKIYGSNDKLLTDTDIIGTGMKIELKGRDKTKTFTLVVKGDANGNGESNFTDLVTVNKARLNKITLEEAYFLAADVTENGIVDFSDLIRINKFRLHKISEL